MIQGGTRLGKDVPPYVMIGREPACYEGLNLVGLKRRGFTAEQIASIQEVYRNLYMMKMNTTQALEAIEANVPETAERKMIVDFVRASQRGIIRASRD